MTRNQIEDEVERLIALLDQMDGDRRSDQAENLPLVFQERAA